MANLKDIGYGVGKYLTASDAADIPDIGTNRKNIDLLNFKVAVNNAYALYNFKDGMIDAYQTEGGVDTGGSSTTTTYDSADKFFWGREPSVVATGGTVTTVGDYTFHYFTASGDFVTDTSQSIDWLLIGGGGAGGRHSGGGGGAGGLVYQAGRTIAAGTHAYVHGTGGPTKTTDGVGADGNSSTWTISSVTMTAQGGGGGGYHATTGSPGGSGGGGSRGLGAGGAGRQSTQPGDSGTYGFSYPGGAGNTGTNPWPAGGGGGAGAAGSGTSGGNSGPGGAGKEIAIFSAFGVAGFFAGGGGGQTQDTDTHGSGGSGGGGDGGAGTPSPAADGAGRNGVDYTGSGGGGSSSHSTFGTYQATGGDGTLLLRRPTGPLVTADFTLLSNAQTAQADPTEGRLMLYEEDVDAITLDTDLKGYVSRDGGTTYTQTLLTEDTVYGQFGIDETTKLLLHMDGSNGGTTFTDSSDLPHTVTAVGNAHTDTAVKKFGTASYQGDGTGDYLTIPASDDWDFGTGDFTVDAWVYASSANTYGFGQYAGGGAYAINQGGGTEVNWYRNGGSALNFGSGSSPTANTWTHVAIVRSSGTTTYYKDGVVTGSAQSDTFDYDGSGDIYYVGSVNANAGHPPLNGYIDEFRISKGVARWTAAFTPPTHAYGANQRILSGSVDISGQPAGSNMKYKVTTHNDKALKLHGASLLWA